MSDEKQLKILGFPVDWLIKMLMQLLRKLILTLVDAEQITVHQKLLVRTGYYLFSDWGVHFAADTETDGDDAAVEELRGTCQDLANEGGFALPTVEPL